MAVPHFAVFYDVATQRVIKTVHVDYSPTDSEDNIKRGLALHREPGQGMVLIPSNRIDDTDAILSGMGLTR